MRDRVIRRNGFTLVEALAAFAILALSMSALFSGVSGAVHNEVRAEFLLRATRQGQSHLETLGASSPIVIGETRGQYEDGLLWSLNVEPLQKRAHPASAVSNIAGYWVRLIIQRPGSKKDATHTFSLATVKLTPIEEQRR
jgi:general secretion pathway protein I